LRRRQLLLDGFILVVGVVAALALGEAVLRIFWPQRSDVTLGMFEPDPAAGYRLRGDYASEVRVPEYRTRVVTDAEGYRVPESEPSPAKGAARVLAVGDSFTFGVGVAAEDAFPEQLEAGLNAAGGRPWDVRNGGVGGYGPQRTSRALRGRQAKWNPDVVIHAVYVGNDLEDSDPATVAEDAHVHDGRLISPGHHPLLALRLMLRTRSHLYAFLRQNLYGLYRASGLWQRSQYLDPVGLATWPARVTAVTWPAARGALADIRDWAAAHDVRYLVVVVPTRWQVNEEAWERYRNAWRKPDDAFDRDHAQREVSAALTELGVPSVNLLPALRRAEAAGIRTYYSLDPHWTADGHALAAQVIQRKMVDLGWLGAVAAEAAQIAGAAEPEPAS
jgi:hypothetical protein